jgi:hypothetical protein
MALWQTKKFRAMKTHALRSISKMHGVKAEEALERATRSPDRYLKNEAERLRRKA